MQFVDDSPDRNADAPGRPLNLSLHDQMVISRFVTRLVDNARAHSEGKPQAPADGHSPSDKPSDDHPGAAPAPAPAAPVPIPPLLPPLLPNDNHDENHDQHMSEKDSQDTKKGDSGPGPAAAAAACAGGGSNSDEQPDAAGGGRDGGDEEPEEPMDIGERQGPLRRNDKVAMNNMEALNGLGAGKVNGHHH